MDDDFLLRAVGLAAQAIGLSEPNPRVGCVLVSPSGEVLGQGHTQQAGGPHAEVMALRDAESRGLSVAGATAYVTLEPCAHHGRTPPCADALVRAGLGRVVVALMDPNPLVGGKGVARLRDAGIAVDVVPPTHPAAVAAWELNIGFLSRMVRHRPWVRMKMAGSLDGRTALGNGQSKWITGEAARSDGQVWRARAGAVLTGIGTVLADDPRLDVRAIEVLRQPLRVVLDTHWRTPVDARIWDQPGDALVMGMPAQDTDPAAHARYQSLVDAGRAVAVMPLDERRAMAGATANEGSQRLDLDAVLAELTRRQINELHVEAGARLNAAWIACGLVDEYLIYLAPKLIGPGRALADLPALSDLAEVTTLCFHDAQMVGNDLRVLARPIGAGAF
ncbi:MAG: bifunctional diaminohydroxyphosphoribosylaminopyrimidine deaminase/5-amino-6-(5-phosphoribosylamino)uracil reductase RibD [Aquabacterium sp.]|uniref:bifunctional diaminohydroxyphosphoribosylaminopyrimidine deaminase/5-amino-6-(5-phosphoribosylamino)uracil reductase RibD n=1 Tax=Aquabacterium sp. TaxID=1872578 RepID=UPI0012120C28|nr:bifunctional diaminohydroxyphosphoribosylaminopyrimidine deaminase/5-amino-6-(5-phosphoribosylamino)uracil reductase RibD [Aquabacterium sp.]TAK97178.1 MAG: bifunctional diaminohydroxyphosphoribosylaminopyrimidine deaminase/5-amino-6-(5-phosphoribosylamino)uracil reductase RibD [Aquabacterium sp.]